MLWGEKSLQNLLSVHAESEITVANPRSPYADEPRRGNRVVPHTLGVESRLWLHKPAVSNHLQKPLVADGQRKKCRWCMCDLKVSSSPDQSPRFCCAEPGYRMYSRVWWRLRLQSYAET